MSVSGSLKDMMVVGPAPPPCVSLGFYVAAPEADACTSYGF
jgi:hypothetical protein